MPRRGDNIHRRIDGRWEGRYRCYIDNNSYKYKSVYGKSYGEVKERLALLMQANGSISDKSRMQVGDAAGGQDCRAGAVSFCSVMEEWLLYIEQTRKHSTYMKYLNIYKKYIKENLCNVRMSEISDHLVKERLFSAGAEENISNSIKYYILAVINQTLQYASESHGCPAIKLKNKLTKEKNRPAAIINHSEQAKLLSYLYSDLNVSKAGIILCISTGLRLGEICSLRWEDIDLEQMLIHVNRTVQRIAVKNGSSKTALMVTPPKSVFSIREIPVSDAVRRLLLTIKKEGQDYILGGKKPMEPRTYENHFKKYLKEVSIKKYNFHVLRHTFATNCIDCGMDIKSLSEILGHSDVQITLNRYVHPTMDTKRRQINVLSSVYGQYCGQESEECI